MFHTDLRGPIGSVTQLTDGSLRIKARLARVGTQEYKYPGKDKPVLEYRDPVEVFNEHAMASARGVSVTVGHPGKVTAETWKSHAIGHVGDDVRKDGDFLAADVIVKDHDVIQKVLAKELTELSCGYTCKVVPVSGKAWDAEQTNIEINHVALGPKGWGRAGPDVRLHMDSAYSEAEDPNAPTVPPPRPQPKPVSYDTNMELTEALKKVAELEAAKAKAEQKADAAEAEATALKAKAEQDAKLRQDAADAAQAKADADKRAELVATIAQVYPEYKADGKSLDALAERAEVALAEQAKHKAAPLHQDSTGAAPEKDAYTQMVERNKNAWKGEGK